MAAAAVAGRAATAALLVLQRVRVAHAAAAVRVVVGGAGVVAAVLVPDLQCGCMRCMQSAGPVRLGLDVRPPLPVLDALLLGVVTHAGVDRRRRDGG